MEGTFLLAALLCTAHRGRQRAAAVYRENVEDALVLYNGASEAFECSHSAGSPQHWMSLQYKKERILYEPRDRVETVANSLIPPEKEAKHN